MKRVASLPSFERSLKALTPQQKQALRRGLHAFNQFLVTGALPPGLGYKKINGDKYELRADIRLRVILKLVADCYYLVLVGNHDQVKRYLKQYR